MIQPDFQHLLVEQEGGVLTITMNRPEVLNAFNDIMLEELGAAIDAAAQDESVRCVVITGAGGNFGSGQDLRVFAALHAGAGGEPVKVGEHLQKYHRVILAIRNMPRPVVAAVRGVAAGISCNVALSCDLRIAADDARFIEAFARIGLVPDGGGGYFLPRLVGLGKALELAMLAEEVSGPVAERIGLVNRCVPVAEFEAATKAFAQRLANGPTHTYGLIKQLMNASFERDLQSSLKLEGELQDDAIRSEDHREGLSAFLQKRKPHYKGR